jgi:hypothetical protein
MEKPELRGKHGWAIVAATVLAVDTFATDTMSEAYANLREHQKPTYRALAVGCLAVTTSHLLGIIPERIDPFHRSVNAIRGLRQALRRDDGTE